MCALLLRTHRSTGLGSKQFSDKPTGGFFPWPYSVHVTETGGKPLSCSDARAAGANRGTPESGRGGGAGRSRTEKVGLHQRSRKVVSATLVCVALAKLFLGTVSIDFGLMGVIYCMCSLVPQEQFPTRSLFLLLPQTLFVATAPANLHLEVKLGHKKKAVDPFRQKQGNDLVLGSGKKCIYTAKD